MYVNIYCILWYEQNLIIIYVFSQLTFSFTNLLAIQTKTVYSHYSNTSSAECSDLIICA